MKLTKAQIKDILTRALKTFAQAFISALSVDTLFGVTDLDTLKRIGLSMLIAGVAAGVSAVWNMTQDFIFKWIEKKFPTDKAVEEPIQKGLDKYDEV